MRLVPATVFLFLTIANSAAGQSPYLVDSPAPPGFGRDSAGAQTLAHLTNLISLDTQNPPGNERLTAEYFENVFGRLDGVETEILDVGNGRANFVARIRAANPVRRPVLVMGHMDVVGADTAKWTSPPFEATRRDEYVYGRGAIDDKGPLAAVTTALELLVRHRESMTRDIILLATAAEEGGDVGIDWVVTNRPDVLENAEFALNEGGRVRIGSGFVRTVNIQVTEKVPYNVRVIAHGKGGHGSVPLPENALAALARAVNRVHQWRAPVNVSATTRLYFSRLARIEEDADVAAAMRQIASSNNERMIRQAANVLSRQPLYNAVLRTGASLTLISGGIRSNVIPSDGTANFNVRIVPGEDIREVVREMQFVGAESQVTFELDGAPRSDPPPSPVNTALYRAMEAAARAMEPRTTVIPFMSTGATDGAVLRARGIPTYGLLPLPLAMDDEMRMHGDNERVPVEALGWGTEYVYRVLWRVTH